MLTIEVSDKPIPARVSPETAKEFADWLRSNSIDPYSMYHGRPVIFIGDHVTFAQIVADATKPQLGDRVQPIRPDSSGAAIQAAAEWVASMGSRAQGLVWTDENDPNRVIIAHVTYPTPNPLPAGLANKLSQELDQYSTEPKAVELGDMVLKWRAAKLRHAEMEEALKEARQEILDQLRIHGAEIATADGRPIAQRKLMSGRKTFQKEDFGRAYPDLLAQYTVTGADFEQLDVLK